MDVNIEPTWKAVLTEELSKPYYVDLTNFVRKEYLNGAVYPAREHIYRAFELTPFDKVKVVILGQDPYHGAGQATGLAFSVPEGVRLPPSLHNIFRELRSDVGGELLRSCGDLGDWASQGVLLLNAVLTVRDGAPASHQGRGWEQLTGAVIHALSQKHEHLVFILWGKYAKEKGVHIDRSRHLVIESAHPSPFSALRGFYGSRPFSRTNSYLAAHEKKPIRWL